MSPSSRSGPARPVSSADAPARSGKTTRPPRPKVKPSGGLPANTSSGVGRSTWAENVSAMASTSRWKCMQPLGRPAVPEVKAVRGASGAAGAGGAGGEPQQVVGRVTAVGEGAQPRYLGLDQVVGAPRVAQRVPDPGDVADRGEFAGPLGGQDGHRARARLHDGEPAGGQPGGGGAAQQHPVAGDDAERGGEGGRDAG